MYILKRGEREREALSGGEGRLSEKARCLYLKHFVFSMNSHQFTKPAHRADQAAFAHTMKAPVYEFR
jgi:hypothetical protein